MGYRLRVAVRRIRARAAALLRLTVCLLPVALAACMGHDIEAVRDLRPDTGDSFTQTLAEDYRRIALFEADEMYDWIDAGHFAVKGLEAGAGKAVEPEPLADWHLPADVVPDLEEARRTLLTALENRGASAEAGRLAARAQSHFDCWVEQQEENHQWDHIAACRDGFYSHLNRLSALLESRSEPVATPAALPAPPSGATAADVPVAVALFAFDSARLDEAAMVEVASAVDAAARLPEAAIIVVGHTDRKGSDAYNLDLSLRRAEAVRDALIERGVAADRIDTIARGEWDPVLPTADEVAEPANRRAEIFILPAGGTPPVSSQQTQVPVAPAGADAPANRSDAAPACFDSAGARIARKDPRREETRSGPRSRQGPCAWRAPNRQFEQHGRRSEAPPGTQDRPAEDLAVRPRAGSGWGVKASWKIMSN